MQSDPNGPAMTFDHLIFKFDTLIQGDTVIHEFRFTNTGKSPLVISDVTSSCGCVCPTYSKEPVAPGKTGVVRMDFRTAGKFGVQDKTLWVRSNAKNGDQVLHMKGIIVSKPVQRCDSGAQITFIDYAFDFDTIKQNNVITRKYYFTNTGNEPLIISDVINAGGGMYPYYYPKESIAPGASGFIIMTFNSVGKSGHIGKIFNVHSNAINSLVALNLSGIVVASKTTTPVKPKAAR